MPTIEYVQITETSRGTLHLPAVTILPADSDDVSAIVFNWVPVEGNTELVSTRLVIRLCPDEAGPVETVYEGPKEPIEESMAKLGDIEAGCWTYLILESVLAKLECVENVDQARAALDNYGFRAQGFHGVFYYANLDSSF